MCVLKTVRVSEQLKFKLFSLTNVLIFICFHSKVKLLAICMQGVVDLFSEQSLRSVFSEVKQNKLENFLLNKFR